MHAWIVHGGYQSRESRSAGNNLDFILGIIDDVLGLGLGLGLGNIQRSHLSGDKVAWIFLPAHH